MDDFQTVTGAELPSGKLRGGDCLLVVFYHDTPREQMLTAKEFLLLQYFVAHRGATLDRDRLLDAVWGSDAAPLPRTVDVYVSWLRKKVEPQPRRPRYIMTVHRVGYRFVG